MARMTPDLLVTWPTNCDFPLFRKFLRENRSHFDQVIAAFSPMPGHMDCSDGVSELLATSDVTYIWTQWEDGWDWRDAAVNAALNVSGAEWVWFTEPDFRIIDPFFWTLVDSFVECSDVIGVRADVRWHPCCLFVRRDAVERTERYFGSDPIDHFYRFGQELEERGARFTDIDLWLPGTYNHMAGLSHNHCLVERGERVTYRPDEFATYLYECLHSEEDLLGSWRVHASTFLARYHGLVKED